MNSITITSQRSHIQYHLTIILNSNLIYHFIQYALNYSLIHQGIDYLCILNSVWSEKTSYSLIYIRYMFFIKWWIKYWTVI